jgi:hypothetical protein
MGGDGGGCSLGGGRRPFALGVCGEGVGRAYPTLSCQHLQSRKPGSAQRGTCCRPGSCLVRMPADSSMPHLDVACCGTSATVIKPAAILNPFHVHSVSDRRPRKACIRAKSRLLRPRVETLNVRRPYSASLSRLTVSGPGVLPGNVPGLSTINTYIAICAMSCVSIRIVH